MSDEVLKVNDEDEPQPEYCDCDGFHDGSCRSREIKRLNELELGGTPTFSCRNGEYFKDGKPFDVLLELCELTGDVECYEGMKEGVGVRIVGLEQEIADLQIERDKWKLAALSESYDQLAALFEEQEQQLAKTKGLLESFQQAVIHVTENGKTTRSVSSSDGWAMVHLERLTDLEVCEERLKLS